MSQALKGTKTDLYHKLCDYVLQLKASVTAFCDVLAPERPGAFEGFSKQQNFDISEELHDWAKRFSRLNVAGNFLPLLMAARLKTSPKTYVDILQLCEKMAFRTYILKGSRSHAGAPRLHRLSADIFKGERIDILTDRLIHIAISTCDYDGMVNAFKPNAIRRDWYSWKGIRYFLYEFERYCQDSNPLPPIIDWNNIGAKSIEHILPQDSSDAYWKERFKTKTALASYTNDLGNLTLTSAGDNAYMANSSFIIKRGKPQQRTPCYANSNFRMTREIASEFVDWEKASIKLRREHLVEWALQRWDIPFEGDPEFVRYDETEMEAAEDDIL